MADGLSLNISSDSNALDYDLAKSVAADFRVSPTKADEIIVKIKNEVKNWEEVAENVGIPKGERLRMKKAFRI